MSPVARFSLEKIIPPIFLFFVFFIFFSTPLLANAGACRCALETTSDCYTEATGQPDCDNLKTATADKYKFCSYFAEVKNCQGWVAGGGQTLSIKDINKKPEEKLPFQAVTPKPEVDIPTLKPFTTNDIKPDSEGYIYVPFIGQYLSAIFRWALLVAGILATILIMFGGLVYMTSGGNAQRAKEGKERAAQAVLGLLLLLASYSILYIINPDLVSFKSLKIQTISRDELEIKQIVTAGTDESGSSENISPTASKCLTKEEQASLQGVVTLSGGAIINSFVHKDLIEPLKKANEALKTKGKQLVVISAARTIERQQQLWEAALQKYGNETAAKKFVSKPSCSSPHTTGRAIDICIKDSASCGKISGANASYTDNDVKLLQETMKAAGWNRYCGEWWHFEYGCSGCPKNNRVPGGCAM